MKVIKYYEYFPEKEKKEKKREKEFFMEKFKTYNDFSKEFKDKKEEIRKYYIKVLNGEIKERKISESKNIKLKNNANLKRKKINIPINYVTTTMQSQQHTDNPFLPEEEEGDLSFQTSGNFNYLVINVFARHQAAARSAEEVHGSSAFYREPYVVDHLAHIELYGQKRRCRMRQFVELL